MASFKNSRLSNAFQISKPYIAMISLQFGYAGMNIMTKVSLNGGMSHYVLVVYRHAIATIAMAPFAFFFERKERPKLTFCTFCLIFALALLGPVIDQNVYYAGLKLTTPTFSCALSNTLPAMAFVMALLCRMERLSMKQVRSQAKIVGTLLSVGGAMLMTLYTGPAVHFFWSPHPHHPHDDKYVTSASAVPGKDWIKGSLLIIASCLAWAGFFILQAFVAKKYSAQLSLTTLICFLGTLQSAALTLVIEHKPSVWAIGWDINLLTAVYSGVVASGIAYYVQGLCMELKGPVFATAFSPLMMIIVAVMGSIILAETIYLGSVLGAILIVVGLYAVLWGKVKDHKIPTGKNSLQVLPTVDVKANDDTEAAYNKITEVIKGGEGNEQTESKNIGSQEFHV